jgi:hypothetical protein
MAGSRTLKLSILADVADLRDKLGQGSKEVETFGSKLTDFGKKAGLAFAAAGAAAAAYAGKLLVDGVKSAIEDEKAQAKLATTLGNVAGATRGTINATEDYITKTTLATGVADDELRPSLERLVRATKDVEEAQRLQGLALDIAAGSGKSLDAVSQALGKAYEGNTASLGRLGIGIEAAQLKEMSFDQVTKALADTFGNQASVQAETFEGKMARLSVAFNEGKETVGAFVLDAITPMVTAFVEKVIPAISKISTGIGEDLQPIFEKFATFFQETLLPILTEWWDFITGTIIPGIKKTLTPIFEGLFSAFDSIATAIEDNEEKLKPLFKLFKSVATFVAETLAPAIGEVLGAAFKVIGKIIKGFIDGFSEVVSIINSVVEGIKSIINLVKNNAIVKGISGVIDRVFGGGKARGGTVSSSKSYLVGERGPELFLPNTNGTIVPNNKLGGGVTNNISINVTGALDREGVARQIVDLLNNSFYRGTLGAGAFQT